MVPDADTLYRAFADGLRAAYGKVPRAGIPVAGFSVVDPGESWLRAYRCGDSEDAQEKVRGLALVVRSAARQGDARGDDAAALKMLDAGLARHAGAPTIERLPALVYRAELAVRMGDRERVVATLADIRALDLDDAARVIAAPDLATAAEIERDLA